MQLINILRWVRNRSRIVRLVHARLREPYYAALERIYAKGIPVRLPGNFGVRLHPRLLGIQPDHYEAEFSSFLSTHVRPGMTVLDLGAHVGIHTLRLSKLVGPAGRVVAVEPSPANAALLRRHLEWNEVTNAAVIEAAVSRQVGAVEFAFHADALNPGSFANSIAYDICGVKSRIPSITIDAICDEFDPDLIKIDIEGAEMHAIEGAKQVLMRAAPTLLVAFHPEAMGGLNTTPSELVALLREFGYRGWHLDGRELTTTPAFEELVFRKVTAGPNEPIA